MKHLLINRLLLLLFMLAGANAIHSQGRRVDSMLLVLESAQSDTAKIRTLLPLSFELRSTAPEEALKYAKTALSLSRKAGNRAYEAKALNNMGLAYLYQSDFNNAIEDYNSALRIAREINDSTIIALEFSQLGNAYKAMSNYPLAIDYHRKSLAIRERTHDSVIIAQTLVNLGNAYVRNSEYAPAIKNFLRALDLLKSRHLTTEYANAMNGIANVLLYQKNPKSAIGYYLQSFAVFHATETPKGMSTALLNIGECYTDLKNYDSALFYLDEAHRLLESISNKYEIGDVDLRISAVHEEKGNLKLAINYAKRADTLYRELEVFPKRAEASLTLASLYLKNHETAKGKEYLVAGLQYADSIKDQQAVIPTYIRIANCYRQLGDADKAYMYLERTLAVKDSLFSTNSTAVIAQMQSAFDLRNKENEIDLFKSEKAIADYEINRQRIIIISLFGSALLFVLLVFFIYRGYKKTRDTNKRLSEANELINEKNKSISDSILYAKNIQHALLKLPAAFEHGMKDAHFILYKPKDVVSGDFYWVEIYNDLLLIAAADCTGHGVPGSLMSMLGIEKLKQATREKGLTRPGEILSFVNRSFRESIGTGDSALRDGMDIALCCLDISSGRLLYSGANRPLWIMTTDMQGHFPVREIKPVKVAIGGFTEDAQEFETHELFLRKGDSIYLFTDGFADQFGGNENKKFNMKRFREMLPSIASKPMARQKSELDKIFQEWKGSHEQIDDVMIIGFRML